MSVKKVHSGEEKEPYNSVNRTNKTVEELSQNGQREQKNTLTRRSPRKVVKKKKNNRVTKDRQPGERRLQQNP